MCSGNWIVASAGDDISLPERVGSLVSWWLRTGGRLGLVYSNILEVDLRNEAIQERNFITEGRISIGTWGLQERLDGLTPPVHGCAFAYPQSTSDDFGSLHPEVCFEDNVLNWRAELVGGVGVCPATLVRHRNHGGQFTNLHALQGATLRRARLRTLHGSDRASTEQNRLDLESAARRGWIREPLLRIARSYVNRRASHAQRRFLLCHGSWIERFASLIADPSGAVRDLGVLSAVLNLAPVGVQDAALDAIRTLRRRSN